jgi:hypothetical protein
MQSAIRVGQGAGGHMLKHFTFPYQVTGLIASNHNAVSVRPKAFTLCAR